MFAVIIRDEEIKILWRTQQLICSEQKHVKTSSTPQFAWAPLIPAVLTYNKLFCLQNIKINDEKTYITNQRWIILMAYYCMIEEGN